MTPETHTLTEETGLRLLRTMQRLEVLLSIDKEREAWKFFVIGVVTAQLIAILIVIIVATFLTGGVQS